MEIGVIGLGKMGLNLALNLKDNNFTVKGYDINEIIKTQETNDLLIYSDLDNFFNSFKGKKIIWVMVPCGKPTEDVLEKLINKLSPGDIVIEGGNSNYKDSVRRSKMFEDKKIDYLDVGTSGGTSGARKNACLMIGGKKEVFEKVEKVFKSLAIKDGYLYTGPSGSGHFLKMIHNGIEYGMMQSIAEGFHILEKSTYDYDFEAVARLWNSGSVIRSWLMELTQKAFKESPRLEEYSPIIAASGEGKWTVQTALELNVASPVIGLSLMLRSLSQDNDAFFAKVVAAQRHQFGGHDFVKKEKK